MSPAKETRQSAAEQLRAVSRDQRTVDIVASDFSLDSHGTRIDPAGWELEQFKKNPVICLQHDSWGRSESAGLPVANAVPETVRIENGKLVMRLRFPEAGKFPLADQVFELVADGFLRGVSVGFDPQEYEDVEEEEGGYKKQVRVYRKQRLMEVSIVTIPSNDNGMVVRARQLNREADVDAFRKKTEEMEKTLSETPAPRPAATTLRIKDVAVTVEVRDGDLAAFEKEFTKVVGYFDKKQPANRASTKVLARFFKARNLEAPAEEVEAWEQMGEMLHAETTVEAKEPSAEVTETTVAEIAAKVVETIVAEEEKPAGNPEEAKPEEAPVEQAVEEKQEEAAEQPAQVKPEEEKAAETREEPAPAPEPEAKEETPPQSPNPSPAQEAPAPERKASVHITLSALKALPAVLSKALTDEAAEALRRGMPSKDLGGFLDERGKKLLESLIHS